MAEGNNTDRIVKNSAVLYIRLFIVMLANLYISRKILNTLGVLDYGTYNVVGGFVMMFSILTGPLTAACGRFLSFALGKKDIKVLTETFSTSLVIHLALAIIVFLVIEPIGLWYVNAKMQIDSERLLAANWVLQCSIATFILNIISVPYNALIVSHENMSAYAYISIFDIFLKLASVLLLIYISSDKLIFYVLFLLISAIIIRLTYSLYCTHQYKESIVGIKRFQKKTLRSMLSFASWNFIGTTSGVMKDQGVNLLLNYYCGLVINAANGINTQVRTAVLAFSNGILSAINPQIIKSYAANEKEYMFNLVFKGCKYVFFLILIIALPIFFNTSFILLSWLGTTPPTHTNNFIHLTLAYILLESYSGPLITLMLATGRIKNYQIAVGITQFMNFPISWFLLKSGYSSEIVFIVAIFISFIVLLIRIIMLRNMVQLPCFKFVTQVLVRTLFVSTFSIVAIYFLHLSDASSFQTLATNVGLNWIIILLSILLFGLSSSERKIILSKISAISFLHTH